MIPTFSRHISASLAGLIFITSLLPGCQKNALENEPSTLEISGHSFDIPERYGRVRVPVIDRSDARSVQGFSLTAGLPDLAPFRLSMDRPLTELEYDTVVFIDVSSEPMIDLEAYLQRYEPSGRLRFVEGFDDVSKYFFHAMLDRRKSTGDREVYIHNLEPKFYASCGIVEEPGKRESCRLQSQFLDISFSASFSKTNVSSISAIQQRITQLLSSFIE